VLRLIFVAYKVKFCMNIVKRIKKNFTINLTALIGISILGLARTMLLTKALEVEDFGKILIVLNFFLLVSAFFSVRVNDIIYRFYPEFKNKNDLLALKGIILASFYISIITGLILFISIYSSANWISNNFYNNNEYELLFKIYAVAGFVTVFDGFSSSLLRLKNRFLLVVVPQLFGALLTLVLLFIYLQNNVNYNLNIIILFLAIGTLISSVLPLAFSIWTHWKYVIYKPITGSAYNSIIDNWKKIKSTLLQTNLTALLKLGSDTGGIFLLGVLSSPAQVALYSIANQLLRPFALAQNGIQTAIMPEIVSLCANSKYLYLYGLIKKYTFKALIGAGLLLITIIPISKPLLLFITSEEYILALPVVYILSANATIGLVSSIYYSLAVSMDKLWKRNLIVSFRFIYLALGVAFGLNAIILAIVSLLGSITVKIFNDLYLFRLLKKYTT